MEGFSAHVETDKVAKTTDQERKKQAELVTTPDLTPRRPERTLGGKVDERSRRLLR